MASTALIEKHTIDCDKLRNWEKRHLIQARAIVFVKVDISDLEVKFIKGGSQQDIIDIPTITFGESPVTIEFGENDRQDNMWVKFASSTGSEIVYYVCRSQTIYIQG